MKKAIKFFAAALSCAIVLFSAVGCRLSVWKDLLSDNAVTTSAVDAAKMTNDITTDKIHALFTVYAENEKVSKMGPFERVTASMTAQGSAVAFYRDDRGYVFILTNCHVAQKRQGYDRVSYEVVDYSGNRYSANLLSLTSKSGAAISAEYDLACLYFKSDVEYTTLSVAKADPSIGETIVALGAPENQSNAITFGKVVSYTNTEVEAEEYLSNVTFPVIYHDAFIDSGSSGGPIINSAYEIVGINYGGSEDNTVSLAVPASKVWEFLRTYVYE